MEATDPSTAIDLLPGYTETKLKLASIAEILLTLARERKDEERTHAIQRLLADLAEDAFRLAVVGKYNRGKSSLMNAMLGHDWLPTGILPLTSVITTVRYGTKQRVLIRTEGSSLAHEIPLDNLARYVTEEHNPGNEKHVESAEVQLPSDLLRYGFLFIDTPGLGSGITANTEATRRFLPDVDAAIVVLSFESPLDQGDIDLLVTFHRMRRKLFIVLNKADLVSAAERDHITSFVRDRLAEQLQEMPLLFPLSARDGLSARTTLNDALLGRSGLKQFEDQLVHFLTTQKSDLFLHRLIERTRDLLEQEKLESLLSEQLNLDLRKTEALNAIKQREKDLLTKVNATFARFEQQLPGLFYTLLDDDLRLWYAERKNEILNAAIANQEFRSDGISERLRMRVPAVMQQLRESEKLELNALVDAFSDLHRRGTELLGRENPDSADAAGLLEFIAIRDIEVPNLRPFEWIAPEWSRVIPSNWLRKRVVTRLEKELSLAIDSHCAAVRAPLEQACQQWLERGRHDAVRRIQAYAGRLEALRKRSDEAETTSILQDLTRQLDKIVQNANAFGRADEIGYSGTRVNRSEGLCFVCRKASDAAFHFLRRLQYQLTKDPKLQEDIGKGGGLCPFHTWMYESMGSPQGIAQGYASVLETLGRRLEELTHEETIARISEMLIEVLPKHETCKVCHVAATAESGALDEIANAEAIAETGRNLCFIHLAGLLPRLKNLDAAKRWIHTEAVQFRRLAQDMRQFALKHNALRHYLATEGEQDAYLHGLMQLVGARQLSFVRKVQDLL